VAVCEDREGERIGEMMAGLKGFIHIISSRSFLVWIVSGWVIFYITGAIFLKEAFAFFIGGLRDNPLIYIPFVLFLLSGYANLLRRIKDNVRENSWKIIGFIAPFGLMVFLTGFFISVHWREFDWIVTGEGDVIRPRWSEEEYQIVKVNSGIKDRFLDMEEGGILAHEPRANVKDRESRMVEIGAFPAKRLSGNYLHILNFGIAPRVVLSEDSRVVTEGYIPMRILPPGSYDFFEIPPYPYRFTISLSPERIIQKGGVKAMEYNIKNPLFRLKVTRGDKVISETEGVREIALDGVRLTIGEPIPWLMLEVVHDPGLPVMVSGIFLSLIGIPLWFLFLLIRRVSHG